MTTNSIHSQARQAYTFSKEYRPEIDGLRALAVVGVMLFHAGFSAFGGGFVGVDVFFVISGYLITKIIVTDCERGKFHYLIFMSRRIARLYPALLATLFVCLAIGFVLFSAEDYQTLALSTLSAFFSASNFAFWQSAGYFDASSRLNPLLHTWSLGVEQQFYLVWPLLIYVAFRVRRVWLPYVLLTAGLVSLAASQWYTSVDPSASYFLTPLRVFEFAAGGLIPWVERARLPKNAWMEVLLAVGLALLLYSAMAFDSNTVFPGVNALLPVGGASLCIIAGRARVLGRVLRNRVAVFVGLISYSLYLVHWPVIVFYRYYNYEPLDGWDKYGVMLVPFLLAYPLYRYVETRFRRVDLSRWNVRKVGWVAVCVVAVAAPCSLVASRGGLPFRVNSTYGALVHNPVTAHEAQYGGTGYTLDTILGDKAAIRPDAIFAGDSFALQYAAGFDRYMAESQMKVRAIFEHGCIFGPRVTRLLDGRPRKDCQVKTAQVIDALQDNHLPLIFTMSWTGYENLVARPDGEKISFQTEDDYYDFLIQNLKNLFARIQVAGASVASPDPTAPQDRGESPTTLRKIVIIGDQPGTHAVAGALGCIGRPGYLPLKCLDSLSVPVMHGLGYAINQRLGEAFKDHPNVLFLNPYEVLCRRGRCQALGDRDRIRYSDASHLSIAGSNEVARVFVARIRQFFKRGAAR